MLLELYLSNRIFPLVKLALQCSHPWENTKLDVVEKWLFEDIKCIVNQCTGLSCTLGSLPPGGKAASGQLAPWGWRYPGVSCPPPWAACPRGWSCLWAACPPGVKIPWASCPPPQENLTELNAGRFYVFKIKILIIETWENWFLHVCSYASFSWYEEIEGQNIVALEVCTHVRKPGRLHSKR